MEYAYGRLYVKAYFAFICTPHFADAQRLRLFVSVSELPSATVAGELSGAMPDSHSGGRMAPGPVRGPESAWRAPGLPVKVNGRALDPAGNESLASDFPSSHCSVEFRIPLASHYDPKCSSAWQW